MTLQALSQKTLQTIAHGPVFRYELQFLTRQTHDELVESLCDLIGLVEVDDDDRWTINDAGRCSLELLYNYDAQRSARARDAACRGCA